MRGSTVSLVGVAVVAFQAVATALAPERGRRADVVDMDPVRQIGHLEKAVDPPGPGLINPTAKAAVPASVWVRGPYRSIQVNVDSQGYNIAGDAANEPSLAIDPTAPGTVVIGWRQFDTISSNFRQAGWAYSHDAGESWTFPGVLEPGVFSSDPVLDFDADGGIYYYALQPDRGPDPWACYLYKSVDGGVSWPQELYAFGGDKAWVTIDRTDGIGRGNIYAYWSSSYSCCPSGNFTRSTDSGLGFSLPTYVPESPRWGTLAVGPDGELYVAGTVGLDGFIVAKSTSAKDPNDAPAFEQVTYVDLGGTTASGMGPNPGGLLGQVWIAVDNSTGPRRGHVYLLSSVAPWGSADPLDVMFTSSTDGGLTWTVPLRINDDPVDNDAWQWFGTMSVAPNGRIDVIFNDTRVSASATHSELYYAQSTDGGLTWSENVPVSPAYDHFLGYPQQYKLGDYYDMISDELGANVAYAATFNGEQDVYFLRIGDLDCNGNGVPDADDIAQGTSDDCDNNLMPDECDRDCNNNTISDACDVFLGTSSDCNSNVVPDECESDFDSDGLIDGCDPDTDNDGVPNDSDICDSSPPGTEVAPDGRPVGDSDGDCVVGLIDHVAFVTCIVPGGPGVRGSRSCRMLFDFDEDEDVDLWDFAAFQSFFGGP